MKKLVLLFVFILLAHISESNAALLVEPVLGYNFGAKLDIENAESYTGGSGVGYGGRLGYQKLGFQIGADYLHSTLNFSDSDFDKDVNMDEWAGFVGFEFPILLRVYAGYIFSATGETTLSGVKTDFEKGSGTKLGLGFTGLPFVDINFEYRTGVFSESKAAGVTDKDDTKYQAVFMGLSLPFTF